MREVVKLDGKLLKCASDQLRDTKEIAFQAVLQNSDAFHCFAQLQACADIALFALEEDLRRGRVIPIMRRAYGSDNGAVDVLREPLLSNKQFAIAVAKLPHSEVFSSNVRTAV